MVNSLTFVKDSINKALGIILPVQISVSFDVFYLDYLSQFDTNLEENILW